MSFPHEGILHGDPCDCTLHDIGFNCRRKMTADDLRRELDEVVVVALRSGFEADAVVQAFMLKIEWYRSLKVERIELYRPLERKKDL